MQTSIDQTLHVGLHKRKEHTSRIKLKLKMISLTPRSMLKMYGRTWIEERKVRMTDDG